MYANLNILNDEECGTLLKHQKSIEGSAELGWNKEYELCTGKKHQFPAPSLSFRRVKKKDGQKDEEKKQAKESMSYNSLFIY